MSRKSAAEKRARRQRKSEKWLATREARVQPGSQAALAHEALALAGIPDGEGRVVATRGPKLSARLWELAQPYLHEVSTHEHARRLIDMIALAWNLAEFPPGNREKQINEAALRLAGDDPVLYTEGLGLFTEMVNRKLALFPDDHRILASYELLNTADGWHLNAAAFVSEEDCGAQGGA